MSGIGPNAKRENVRLRPDSQKSGKECLRLSLAAEVRATNIYNPQPAAVAVNRIRAIVNKIFISSSRLALSRLEDGCVLPSFPLKINQVDRSRTRKTSVLALVCCSRAREKNSRRNQDDSFAR
jgi:hypothetical protein